MLPAVVLKKSKAVHSKFNVESSSSNSSVLHGSPGPDSSVPSGLGKMVVGVILILSGDIETVPGPVGEFLVQCNQQQISMFPLT